MKQVQVKSIKDGMESLLQLLLCSSQTAFTQNSWVVPVQDYSPEFWQNLPSQHSFSPWISLIQTQITTPAVFLQLYFCDNLQSVDVNCPGVESVPAKLTWRREGQSRGGTQTGHLCQLTYVHTAGWSVWLTCNSESDRFPGWVASLTNCGYIHCLSPSSSLTLQLFDILLIIKWWLKWF